MQRDGEKMSIARPVLVEEMKRKLFGVFMHF